MKKIISLMLVIVMTISIGLPTFATPNTVDDTSYFKNDTVNITLTEEGRVENGNIIFQGEVVEYSLLIKPNGEMVFQTVEKGISHTGIIKTDSDYFTFDGKAHKKPSREEVNFLSNTLNVSGLFDPDETLRMAASDWVYDGTYTGSRSIHLAEVNTVSVIATAVLAGMSLPVAAAAFAIATVWYNYGVSEGDSRKIYWRVWRYKNSVSAPSPYPYYYRLDTTYYTDSSHTSAMGSESFYEYPLLP